MEQPRTTDVSTRDGEEEAATAEGVRVLEDSNLGVPVTVAGDAEVVEKGDNCCIAVPDVVVATDSAGLKRKRGRPAKGASKVTVSSPPSRQKREEEDVCFICFDGGSLVLCDRRGCPKAYHPACIKRDEAFFRSKAKWNCGWHICSICQKTSHYMCYTCTYSLCKGCTRDSNYVSVRGNKGLCGLCMKTVMLIEKPGQGDNPTCEVDFDDQTSWEYLFKVYWVCLKEKLGLMVDELLQARSPWKRAAPVSCKVETPHDLYLLKDDRGSGSENSCIDMESYSLTNKKPKRSDYLQRLILEGALNDAGYSRQDLPVIGNTCVMKNQINPSDVVVGGSSNVGVVKSEASGVALDISSLLYSSRTEQPFNDFLNDKSWHYLDPTGKAQGPLSMLQLYKWNESRQFPSDLRIWRTDEKQDNSVLLTDALNGKFSKNVSLPYNSQPQSLGSCVTLDHTYNIQVGGRNETKTEIHGDNQTIKHSWVVKVDDTCTQSNGNDESVKSNVLHSHFSSWTVAANWNKNEGQSGNFERREDSSKCEISCHDQPPQSLDLFFELNENPSAKLSEGHQIGGNSEDNGNQGSNRTPEGQSNSGQSCQKPSDSEENSGQSSAQNWERPQPQVIHPCSTSMWQAIFGEPTDFSSIVDVDESVSDLLAEVEAMESLGGGGGGGLESPTSIMKTGGSKDDIEFALGLSPMLNAGKGDSLSSTGDLHLPPQSTAAQEPFRQPDLDHLQRIHGDHFSRSSKVESTFSRISWNPPSHFPWDPKC